MSNPYKEIVETLALDRPHYTRINEIGEMETHCFFCISRYTSGHMKTCLWRRSNQLLDQDIEEDNPWNPCSESEGLPKEDGVYIVTTKKGNIFYDEPFRNGEWWRFERGDVIAWRNELKPYQPPPQNPETPVAEPRKLPEPTPDPLMGWTPEWKEKPNDQRTVKILLSINNGFIRETTGWLDNEGTWYVWYTIKLSDYEKILLNDKVLAWKNLDPYLDPELFEKPTSNPTEYKPLHFVPFEQKLPTVPGSYVLHDDNQWLWHPFNIKEPKSDSMVAHYAKYTHWALIRENKE